MIRGYTEFHWQHLLITGKDAVSFFHRISTQDVLASSQKIPTAFCLTDRHGAMLTYGYFVKENDTLTFFYQQISTENLHDILKQYKVIEKAEWDAPKPVHVTYLTESHPALKKYPHTSVRQKSPVQIVFHDVNWNETFYTQMLDEEFESLRCREGIPRLRHELVPKRLPLECGLGPAVSLNKGCFPGQEVLTKFAHRGENPRTLAGLCSEASDAFKSGWRIGELEVLAGEEKFGEITTATAEKDGRLRLLTIARSALLKKELSIKFRDQSIAIINIQPYP